MSCISWRSGCSTYRRISVNSVSGGIGFRFRTGVAMNSLMGTRRRIRAYSPKRLHRSEIFLYLIS